MTIRYPAKVKIDHKTILASGVDTLYLTFDIDWDQSSHVFKYLDTLKEKAKEHNADYPGELKHPFSPAPWVFSIKPHGAKGYAWMLSSADFTFKIMDSLSPGPRPNVMVEIRSEALWRLGTENAMRLALNIITANGGHIINARLSRVDLCVDVLFPKDQWTLEILEYAVTRATDTAPYYRNKQLTGIRIGKGTISARLYDKPLEIAQVSGKVWMYDIWQIEEVPEGKKIIRVEFQLRRETLKAIGLKEPDDLIEKGCNAWAYCTQNWLKFQDRPGLHHTQRSTFEWWKVIQDGFSGVQDAEPLVRTKAFNFDKQRLYKQAMGLLITMYSIDLEERGMPNDTPVNMNDCVIQFAREVAANPDYHPDVQFRVKQKRSRYRREVIALEKEVTGNLLIKRKPSILRGGGQI